MFKILLTRAIPEAGLNLLRSRQDIELIVSPQDAIIPRKKLLATIKGCHGILPMLTDKMDAELFDAAGPQLKIVANYAVGYDNIDLKEAAKRGILIANTPGVLSNAVAEHTFALLLTAAKRITEADRFTRAGKYQGWAPMLLLGTELSSKTLGIIGLGRIGASVATMATALGMKVLYQDVRRDDAFEKTVGASFATFNEVLAQSDFVSIHVPLLPTTRHLIDAAALAKMKPTAYLINTSRGPIVDEAALVAALKTKRIAGAALDVYEHEPKLAPGLAKLPNVVLTPHTASATIETRSEMAKLAAQAILDVLDGKTPPNLVQAA